MQDKDLREALADLEEKVTKSEEVIRQENNSIGFKVIRTTGLFF